MIGTIPGYRTSSMNDVPGIDIEAVTAWLEANVPGARGPFTFEVIAGGHSNLTYRVVGADDSAFVLRRPPLGHRLASAHDMSREHRVIAGLQQSAVPVAPALGLCTDDIGQRCAVLRHGLRRGSCHSGSRHRRTIAVLGCPPSRRRVTGRHDGGDPRCRSRRRVVSPTSASTTATSPGS